MSDNLPQSINTATLTVFGVELRVHMLDDGRRIIEADDLHRLWTMMAGPDDVIETAQESPAA